MGNSFKISQPAPRFFPLFTSFFLLGFIVSCFLDHQVRRLYQKKIGFWVLGLYTPNPIPKPKTHKYLYPNSKPKPKHFLGKTSSSGPCSKFTYYSSYIKLLNFNFKYLPFVSALRRHDQK